MQNWLKTGPAQFFLCPCHRMEMDMLIPVLHLYFIRYL